MSLPSGKDLHYIYFYFQYPLIRGYYLVPPFRQLAFHEIYLLREFGPLVVYCIHPLVVCYFNIPDLN